VRADDPLWSSWQPWSFKSVLTVLGNRTHLVEVNFRGTWNEPSHPPLIEEGLFDATEAILCEPGEDVSKRATNSSEYLVTGLVVRGSSRSRFTGTAATGRNATYRYYTCGGRQRYGTKTCSADRLPAEALDDAVVHSLLAVYDHVELFSAPVERAAQHRAQLGHDRHEGELRDLDAELAKVDAGSTATSEPSRPWSCLKHCARAGDRPASPARVTGREMKHTDLTAPTPEELTALREEVTEAVAQGSAGLVKALPQALIHEIQVDCGVPPTRPSVSQWVGTTAGRCGSRTVPTGGLWVSSQEPIYPGRRVGASATAAEHPHPTRTEQAIVSDSDRRGEQLSGIELFGDRPVIGVSPRDVLFDGLDGALFSLLDHPPRETQRERGDRHEVALEGSTVI
jgi:hypothetical protein